MHLPLECLAPLLEVLQGEKATEERVQRFVDAYRRGERDRLAERLFMHLRTSEAWKDGSNEQVAQDAYKQADAFLAERRRQHGGE